MDSPGPAEAYRYAQTSLADWELTRFLRYLLLPIISLEAERLAITVAPARQCAVLGGSGTHKSSQSSDATLNDGISLHSNRIFLLICTARPPILITVSNSLPE